MQREQAEPHLLSREYRAGGRRGNRFCALIVVRMTINWYDSGVRTRTIERSGGWAQLTTSKTLRSELAVNPELLMLPFDHYSRYALSRRIINLLRPANKALRILDVGGHSSPLKHFLPDDDVVLTDMEPAGSMTSVEFRFDEYLRSSGTALPFRDGAFDVVTAHDTLEHVPPEFRSSFVGELLRVSRRFLVLSGPIFDEIVVQAEQRVDVFTRKALGWQQPFLHEHLELGLPKSELIERPLTERGFPFTVIPAANLNRWLIIHGLQHYLASLPDTDDLRRATDRAYNVLFSEHDTDGVCYRRAYVISKEKGDIALIAGIESGIHDETAELVETANAAEPLLVALEDHAILMREHLAALHERIFAAEQQALESGNEARDLAAVIVDRERTIVVRDQLIAGQAYEINAIKASIPYRLARGISSPIRWLLGRK